MNRLCQNCKYADLGFTDFPCIDCVIDTNSLWEPKKKNLKYRIKNIIDTIRWYLATH